MSLKDYVQASKAGKKEYESRLLAGRKPTLESLDDILPEEVITTESLGLVQIPIDQIVGTRYDGRSSAFAGNFMPILESNTEFAVKWANLSSAHEKEGIHDPIKAWEYMNQFYVEEGNKRVSVMKYFGAVSIPGTVTRIIPKYKDTKEIRLYYEFMDFYKVSKVNYIWFSEEGSFQAMQAEVGKEPEEMWSEEDKLIFSSVYSRFLTAYNEKGGKALKVLAGDAFLAFVRLYGYDTIKEMSVGEILDCVKKAWEEFVLLQYDEEEKIALKMEPQEEKPNLLERLLPLGIGRPTHLTVAFIYAKTAQTSAWAYMHELGRLHLEQTFPDEVTTLYYENATEENAGEVIEQAIADGSEIIFTTSAIFKDQSLRAAVLHPEVRILNCSLNTGHRYIRTYRARMYEAKFLMGVVAGAMADNDKLMYLADYPIRENIAQINAFALGAKMVNPRAKVYLEWTTLKDSHLGERISEVDPNCISGRNIIVPAENDHQYGLQYRESGSGRSRNLAMPICHWGKFYEQMIRNIMEGTWKNEDTSEAKAINYWWGMSADVVRVVYSQNLPRGTARLVDILKKQIISGELEPFTGTIYTQDGAAKGEEGRTLTAEEIISMDWLTDNVIGSIPKLEELREEIHPFLGQENLIDKRE